MESTNTPAGTPNTPENNISAGAWTKDDVLKLPKMNLLTFAKLVTPLAKEVEAKTGIFYLVPIAQAAHESTSKDGSVGGSGLARNHGNLFGITAGDKWLAAGNVAVNLPTFENLKIKQSSLADYIAANPKLTPKQIGSETDPKTQETMAIVEIHLPRLFREYKTWRDSFFDWGRLISTFAPYKAAYELLKSQQTAAEGIEKMGLTYATDYKYAAKLKAVYMVLAS